MAHDLVLQVPEATGESRGSHVLGGRQDTSHIPCTQNTHICIYARATCRTHIHTQRAHLTYIHMPHAILVHHTQHAWPQHTQHACHIPHTPHTYACCTIHTHTMPACIPTSHTDAAWRTHIKYTCAHTIHVTHMSRTRICNTHLRHHTHINTHHRPHTHTHRPTYISRHTTFTSHTCHTKHTP